MAVRPRKAFTLVEVLLVLIIGAIVAGSAVSLLYTYLKNYEHSTEYTEALQRGQMALTVLRPAVLNAGFGIPGDPEDFLSLKNSLGLDVASPLDVRDYMGMKNSDLRLLYALPSSIGVGAAVDDISSSFTMRIFPRDIKAAELKSAIKSAYGYDEYRWLIFPSAGVPLRTSSVPNGVSLSFSGAPEGIRGSVSPGDRLFFLRYLRACIGKQSGQSIPSLYVTDNGYPAQPQVLGIRRIFFDYSDDTKVLKTWILSQGDTRFPEPLDQKIEWPSQSGYELTSDDRRYYLAVSTADWRIRN